MSDPTWAEKSEQLGRIFPKTKDPENQVVGVLEGHSDWVSGVMDLNVNVPQVSVQQHKPRGSGRDQASDSAGAKAHPLKPQKIVVTWSKDQSIRLWDLGSKTWVLLRVFLSASVVFSD